MSNLKTIGGSPNAHGRVSTHTPNEGHAGAWRALLAAIYITCIVAGLLLVFSLATLWKASADQPTGLILGNIGRSLLAAGILGLLYDLLVREVSRQDQRALLRSLSGAFLAELENVAMDLRTEIARTPLQLDESLNLIDPNRRIEIVRRVLEESIGSQEVAEATLRNVFTLAGERGQLWRDTSHTVEFRDDETLRQYDLIRLVDRISYRCRLNRSTFKVGLLRDRGIMEMIQRESNLDAFWLVEKGFVENDGKVTSLVSFQDFCVAHGHDSYKLHGKVTVLEGGSQIIEYQLPDQLVGSDVRIEYSFMVVVDAGGPYLHVALPCPSVGLHILLRNYVPRFQRLESRVFVPDTAAVERSQLGNDVFEIRTSQVVLKGHGAVILLR